MAVRAEHGNTRFSSRVAVIGAVLVAALGSANAVLANPVLANPVLASPRETRSAEWAAVPVQNAQLSVPGSWLVESAQQLSCGLSPSRGMIFAGITPRLPKGLGCGLTAGLAWIVPATHIGSELGHRRPTAVIHGFAVYRVRSAKGSEQLLVPGLKVLIGARGPLARRVLATLHRSPLSVVLRSGAASPVPAGWTWRHFGGFRFAAPRSWSLQRAHQWATCGTGMEPGTLLLIDATRRPLPLPCPYQIPTAAAYEAQAGLTAVTGRYAADSVGQHYGRCAVRRGVRICLASVTGQGGLFGSVLIFSVSRPHQRAGTFFLLGLSGKGFRARAVFESIGT
jgi:hypothetical protein